MCSIFGVLGNADSEMVRSSAKTMFHRSPDGYDFWFDQDSKISLAHGRLAIRDLSSNGTQPMRSDCRRYMIVFNGEVYNTSFLKQGLKKNIWRGDSDTEVWLASFSERGILETLNLTNGMFAAAIWDVEEKKLFLCRDRFGEKPLYYRWQDNQLVFGSELKSLVQFLGHMSLNRDAIADYLAHSCVTRERSVYSGVNKVLPGEFLEFSYGSNVTCKKSNYWTSKPYSSSIVGDLQSGDLVDRIENALRGSVEEQLISDVPLGAFLSGGIDSSTVVSLARKIKGSLDTFCIGYDVDEYSELKHARAVAAHLNTVHHELVIKPNDLLDLLEELPLIYDEPFADSSQLPTLLLSKFAKEKVTVALSGDGGDEIFWGYNRYIFYHDYLELVFAMPLWMRKVVSSIMMTGSTPMKKLLNKIFSSKVVGLQEKVDKIAKLLTAVNIPESYKHVTSFWDNDGSWRTESCFNPDGLNEMNISDICWYLPDDVLVKVDRASMRYALETRAPFLSKDVFEVACSIPVKCHMADGIGKRLLKEVLYKHVPRHLVDRPKAGFGAPISQWLRHELKEWAWELINDPWLWGHDMLSKRKVLAVWELHQQKKRNCQHELWNIIMLQQWARYWRS